MSLAQKARSFLIDSGLYFGLIVALWLVYRVEARLPRPVITEVADGDVRAPENGPEPPGKVDMTASPPGLAADRPRKDGDVPPGKGETGRSRRPTTVTYGTYVGRTRKDKKKWIIEFGGTPETEDSVQAALNWLVRHQADDGSWSPDCLGPRNVNPRTKCEENGWCDEQGKDFPVAQSGLALLALQGAGNYESNDEKYSAAVRRGLDWLIARQRPDGAIVGPLSSQGDNYQNSFMYEHAMAAFALAEACAVRKAQKMPDEPRLRAATVAAIRFIEDQQHNDGGWRYTTRKQDRCDTSVSGWAMLALKSAREAKLPVKQETIDQTRAFFKSCETEDGRTAYQSGNDAGSDAITGVGMLTHLLLLKNPHAPLVKTSARYLAGQADNHRVQVRGGRAEFYTLYNANLAMFQAGGEEWKQWNDAVRNPIVALQITDTTCRRGSWDPKGTHWGPTGGRIYNTALGALTLEVYYRFAREDGEPGAEDSE